MAKQQDIAGFRRSHKKIPTRMALDDDQNEMAARQKAIGGIKGKPNKVPLNNYSQFGSQNAIGSGGIQPPNRPEAPPPRPQGNAKSHGVGQKQDPRGTQIAPPGSMETSARQHASRTMRQFPVAEEGLEETIESQGYSADSTYGGGTDTVVGNVDVVAAANRLGGLNVITPEPDPEDPYGWRQKLEDIANRQLDPEAAEERIARQRASQEAMIRAQMGSGEAGRSGASALLQGEAGRMAESQARAAELARELDVAELGSVLMNFDLAKDRYDDAEKRQAASAAMYLAMAYDVDYDEAFAMLGLPDNAKSDEARAAFEDYTQDLDDGFDDDGGEEEEETEVETWSYESIDYEDPASVVATIEERTRSTNDGRDDTWEGDWGTMWDPPSGTLSQLESNGWTNQQRNVFGQPYTPNPREDKDGRKWQKYYHPDNPSETIWIRIN